MPGASNRHVATFKFISMDQILNASSSEDWTTIYGPFLWNWHQVQNIGPQLMVHSYELVWMNSKVKKLCSTLIKLVSSAGFCTTIYDPFLWTWHQVHNIGPQFVVHSYELVLMNTELQKLCSTLMKLASSAGFCTTIYGPFLWTWHQVQNIGPQFVVHSYELGLMNT